MTHCVSIPAMSLTQLVAQNLRALRASRELSQQEVARNAGLSISYISMLERAERSPPLDTLETLAKALRVAPVDLLRNSGSRRSRSSRR
jgi:transcriptional regulator with XRE-family HTH domain